MRVSLATLWGVAKRTGTDMSRSTNEKGIAVTSYWCYTCFEGSCCINKTEVNSNVHGSEDRMRLEGLPVDEDTDEEEPGARVGPNGSRDRRSLLVSLQGERGRFK